MSETEAVWVRVVGVGWALFVPGGEYRSRCVERGGFGGGVRGTGGRIWDKDALLELDAKLRTEALGVEGWEPDGLGIPLGGSVELLFKLDSGATLIGVR